MKNPLGPPNELRALYQAAYEHDWATLELDDPTHQRVWTDEDHAAALRTAPRLTRLRELVVNANGLQLDRPSRWASQATLALAASAKKWPSLVRINFAGCPRIGNDWGSMRALIKAFAPRLELLNLASTDLSAVTCREITHAALPKLRVLNLCNNVEVSTSVFATKWRVPRLAHLLLAGTSVDSQLLSLLPSGLRALDLSRCPSIDDSGFREITRIKGLTALDISETTVTSESLRYLVELDLLASLHMWGCRVSPDSLRTLLAKRAKRKAPRLELGSLVPSPEDLATPILGEPWNHVRVLIIGDVGAGKTGLCKAVFHNECVSPNQRESTHSVDVWHEGHVKWHPTVLKDNLAERKIDFTVFDFSGDAYAAGLHEMQMITGANRTLCFIVVDSTVSLNIDDAPARALEHHLRIAQSQGGSEAAVMVVDTKADASRLNDQQWRARQRAVEDIAKKSGVTVEYFSRFQSTKILDSTENCVDALRAKIAAHCARIISDDGDVLLPLGSGKFLARMAAELSSRPAITLDECHEMMTAAGIDNVTQRERLLRVLHDSGRCIYLGTTADEESQYRSAPAIGQTQPSLSRAHASRPDHWADRNHRVRHEVFSLSLLRGPLYEVLHAANSSRCSGRLTEEQVRMLIARRMSPVPASGHTKAVNEMFEAVRAVLNALAVLVVDEQARWHLPIMFPPYDLETQDHDEPGWMYRFEHVPERAAAQFVATVMSPAFQRRHFVMLQPDAGSYLNSIAVRILDAGSSTKRSRGSGIDLRATLDLETGRILFVTRHGEPDSQRFRDFAADAISMLTDILGQDSKEGPTVWPPGRIETGTQVPDVVTASRSSSAPRGYYRTVAGQILALVESGVTFTTVNDIAARVGCTRPTAYKAIRASPKLTGWMKESGASKGTRSSVSFDERYHKVATSNQEEVLDEDLPADRQEEWDELLNKARPSERPALERRPLSQKLELLNTLRRTRSGKTTG